MTESSGAFDVDDAGDAGSERSTQNSRQYFQLEFATKITGLISAVAVSVAVTFNLGYFYGIDINLFTLFSLSEHILFAVEALPIAFIIVTMVFVFFNYFSTFMKKSTSTLGRIGLNKIYGRFGISSRDGVALSALLIYCIYIILLFIYIIYYAKAFRYIFLELIWPLLAIIAVRKFDKRYKFVASFLLLFLLAVSFAFLY
ncbi:MAG: hypothetical protein HZB28_09680 [Methylocystis sp.]|nr:hypothetical protein [Methylocystis sp.]